VDVDRKIINVIGKGSKSRPAFMTDQVKTVFESLGNGKPGELVFPDRKGHQMKRISNAFHRAVEVLGLNDGITDSRQKVVFHTLRHTYASWLVEDGTDLYVVQKLLGHSTLAMTERYAHLGESKLQNAVKSLEKKIIESKKDDVISLRKKDS
jgi:site-specific recombinase XerD